MTLFSNRFSEKFFIEPNSGCWLWTACVNKDGYGRFGTGGGSGSKLAHRYSWENQRGAIPDGLLVLHKCDTPACINPNHLFLGTDADNVRDMHAKKRWRHGYTGRKGEAHAQSKLTEAQVAEIRAADDKHAVIAKKYGVASQTVSQIKLGHKWKHSYVGT